MVLLANAIEAAEQTERLDIAEIMPFSALFDALSACGDDRTIIFCDEASAGDPAANAIAEGKPVVADLHEFAPSQSGDWRWRLAWKPLVTEHHDVHCSK